jgi:hypothetical protein
MESPTTEGQSGGGSGSGGFGGTIASYVGDIHIKLHDISDYNDVYGFRPIISGSLVAMNIAITLSKLDVLQSVTFNSYFDTFGFEGILANMSLLVILMQISRWVYTKFYSVGGRPWSPLVFLAIAVGVQVFHDTIFFYGIINQLKPGKNDMIDALKEYANENGPRALGGHAIFLMVCALFAMLMKDISMLNSFLIVTLTFYLLPFIISIIKPKSKVPVKAENPTKTTEVPEKRTNVFQGAGPLAGPTVMSPKREAFTMYGANGMLS